MPKRTPTQPPPDPATPVAPPKPAPAPSPPIPPVAVEPAVGPDTPVRGIGDVERDVWGRVLLGSPIQQAGEITACYDACKGHTAAALATAYKESSLGKAAPIGSFNALGIGPGNHFPTWADGFASFASRLRSVNTPYVPENISVRTYYQIYVGGERCPGLLAQGQVCANGEDAASIGLYINQFVERVNGWLGAGPGPTVDPWRPYPYPKMVDLIVSKPFDGAGFDRCPFRRPLIRGFCSHITDGPQTQTIEFFRDFFSTGGARATDALTDLVIGADGRIGLLNDWRDPARGGTRAGWANGGVDGLEGDGVAFYRKFPEINVRLVSCEHTGKVGQRWTDAMLASTIEIRTAIAQELKCSWQTYPMHQDWGVSIEQQHRNFATKSCPAEPYISTHAPFVLAEVKNKLKAWQGNTPIPPPPPEWKGPFGLPLDFIAHEFGTLWRISDDTDFPFDPKGSISLAWLKRCEEEGLFPEAEQWQTVDSTLLPGQPEDWISFRGGWRLIRQGERDAWKWLDRVVKP